MNIYFVLVVLVLAAFFMLTWYYMVFKKPDLPVWPLAVGALVVFLSCIILAIYPSSSHKVALLKERKEGEVTGQLLSLSQEKDTYLIQEGNVFQFIYKGDDAPEKETAELDECLVHYDSDRAYVTIVTKTMTYQTRMLFFINEEEQVVKEYNFHIPGKENIVFSFEG